MVPGSSSRGTKLEHIPMNLSKGVVSRFRPRSDPSMATLCPMFSAYYTICSWLETPLQINKFIYNCHVYMDWFKKNISTFVFVISYLFLLQITYVTFIQHRLICDMNTYFALHTCYDVNSINISYRILLTGYFYPLLHLSPYTEESNYWK